MTNDLQKITELYPTAKAPGAAGLTGVFKQWESMGLTPVECTSEDLKQTVTIEHNALKRELKWTTKKLDGVQTLGVMASSMVDMWRYFIKDESRPELSSGKAAVAIKLDGNTLTVGVNPVDDPTVIKGMLIAALFEIVDRDGGKVEEELKEFFTF